MTSSIPDLSMALGSEDDEFYMENTTPMTRNGLHYGHLSADSDGSFASFYYNSSSPVQTPLAVQRYPANLSSLHSPTGPSEFYAGPVRGAGYYSSSITSRRLGDTQ